MRRKCLSLKQIKEHEFRSTVRLLFGADHDFTRVFVLLLKLEKQAMAACTKSIGVFVLGFLLISSLQEGSRLTLEVGEVSLSVPAAYSLLFMSLVSLVLTTQIIQWISVNSIRNEYASTIRVHNFSPQMLAHIEGYDLLALSIPIVNSRFFRANFTSNIAAAILFFLLIFGPLLLLIAISAFFLLEQLELVSTEGGALAERFAAGLGAALLTATYFYIITFFIPLPMKKNTEEVRWNFLYPRAASEEAISRWLEKK